MIQIPFNKPYLTGKETEYIKQAVETGKISGNGMFTQRCQKFFEEKYGFGKCLLTTSCTDALEMAAILCNLQPGDEVIIPSYTFVSTALAFVRQGAKIVFADSCVDNPNIDAEQIESLITPKTKVIVPVHYAGVACDMDKIMALAEKYDLLVVEDSAQAVDSAYMPPKSPKGDLLLPADNGEQLIEEKSQNSSNEEVLHTPKVPLGGFRGHEKENPEKNRYSYQTASPLLYTRIKELALEHRKNPTQAENYLWSFLSNNKLKGYKFRRQHIIGDVIADFVCIEKRLVIEVDGGYHENKETKEYDILRTNFLSERGYKVIRFSNKEVLDNVSCVLENIEIVLKSMPPKSPKGDLLLPADNGEQLIEEKSQNSSNEEVLHTPKVPLGGFRGQGRYLGSIGHFGCFSFHETKNIISGEGGMLAINDERFFRRAEIIWEKGTNRAEFFRGEVNKYGWVDTGSSFLPSEVIAAFLWAQLENLEDIQAKRIQLWNTYCEGLKPLADKGYFILPNVPDYATNNAHMFYLICRSLDERSGLIKHLKDDGILSVFHYLSLHCSEYYQSKHDGRELPNCDRFADCLVRLPMYYELEAEELKRIIRIITNFYEL